MARYVTVRLTHHQATALMEAVEVAAPDLCAWWQREKRRRGRTPAEVN